MYLCSYVERKNNKFLCRKNQKNMIQFNFNRFVKLAKWSLTNDKKYHVKTFLQNDHTVCQYVYLGIVVYVL